jgi:hypothetical protein
MSENGDNSDVSRKLQDIESTLKKIERQARFSSEDQFFFAVSFSLVVLFITLPMNDAINFFRGTFVLSDVMATSVANGIRVIGIVTAMSASLLRYYGSMCSERICKEKRLQSIIILLVGFWFFIFVIGSSEFNSITLTTTLVVVPLGLAIMAFFYFALSFLESRILRFYASKGLIQKSETTPIVSASFAFMCLAYYISFVVAILVNIFLRFNSSVMATIFASIFVVSFILLEFLFIRIANNKTRRGKRRTKVVQKKLVE